MLPREHGAWAQLGLPMVTALALGPSAAGALLALAAIGAFLAHEPVTVLLGHRGGRAKRERRGVALRMLVVVIVVGLCALVCGLQLAKGPTLPSLALPVVLGAVTLGFVLARSEKTLAGEVLAAAAMAAWAWPIIAAAGHEPALGVSVGLFWFLAFGLATLAVRAVSRGRRGGAWQGRWAAGLSLLVVLVGAVLVSLGWMHVAFLVAMAPVAVTAGAVGLMRPSASHLRRLGWGLAAANTLSLCILVVGLSQGAAAAPGQGVPLVGSKAIGTSRVTEPPSGGGKRHRRAFLAMQLARDARPVVSDATLTPVTRPVAATSTRSVTVPAVCGWACRSFR